MNDRTLKTLAVAAAFVLLAGDGLAQDLTRKAPPQRKSIAIINATVHPVSGPAIENASIRFEGGVITAVGAGAAPAAEVTIDAKGAHVYPGLIGAVTQLGLTEIGAVRASRDFDELGDISPEVRAAVAVNPDSTLFPVTRANGVLSAGVFPTGGVMPGRASVMSLDGWTYEDMTVKSDAGLVVTWPAGRGGGRGRFMQMQTSDEDQSREMNAGVTRIEEAFKTAAAYAAARAADLTLPVDIRFEAMRGVLPNPKNPAAQLPVFVQAQDYDQITAAVSCAARHSLKLVIVGGRDAPLLSDLLRHHKVSVIATGAYALPRRNDSPVDQTFALPARLESARIPWCLASGEETPHERNLPYSAGVAAAHGLSPDAALRSITLSAAEILGVADKLGSLDKGKLATLMLTDGDPLEIRTHVVRAFIAGREIDLTNKQTVLASKYREKYKDQTPSPAAPAGGTPAAPGGGQR